MRIFLALVLALFVGAVILALADVLLGIDPGFFEMVLVVVAVTVVEGVYRAVSGE